MTNKAKTVFDFKVQDASGADYPLSQHRGNVMLIVNVASKCGFTKQYSGLEALYQEFSGQGLVVLGFPCHQFGGQEPGSNEAIQQFCATQFAVSFPVLAKVKVKGQGVEPLFEYLCQQQKGLLGSAKIKWNFTKFLVDRTGQVVNRYGSTVTPDKIAADIQALL
jgi:glutathione peroxidase